MGHIVAYIVVPCNMAHGSLPVGESCLCAAVLFLGICLRHNPSIAASAGLSLSVCHRGVLETLVLSLLQLEHARQSFLGPELFLNPSLQCGVHPTPSQDYKAQLFCQHLG